MCLCDNFRFIGSYAFNDEIELAACVNGYYGNGCKSRCQCGNTEPCDHVTGACSCQAGFTGRGCEKRELLSVISVMLCQCQSMSDVLHKVYTNFILHFVDYNL